MIYRQVNYANPPNEVKRRIAPACAPLHAAPCRFTRRHPCRQSCARLAPMDRPPLPPFTFETATQKVRLAEDAWNTRDPKRVALAYTTDSRWRNRGEFLQGREAIEAFLTRKWQRELDYRLIKELWSFLANRIAVRFAYEWHDDSGNWYRSYGNEMWEFDAHGLMRLRFASINDAPIAEIERRYRWPQGSRPDAHPSLAELGF
jgi:nuclear transport factor 2 (NTF2) superfamily protein